MSINRFLKQRAVKIALEGHYVPPRWLDPEGKPVTLTCRTSRISPFRVQVDGPVAGRVGERIATYFPAFGRLEGQVSDSSGNSFLIEIDMPRPTREKLAGKLTWMELKVGDPAFPDAREHARIIPEKSESTLTFEDGTVISCSVLDVSVSGVAVLAEAKPEIGTALAVGVCVGRVIRALPGGFAVRFTQLQNFSQLERLVTRAFPLRWVSGEIIRPEFPDEVYVPKAAPRHEATIADTLEDWEDSETN